MTDEKKYERKMRADIERAGGLYIKLQHLTITGVPDRLALLPKGRMFFVEHKSGKDPLSPRQAVLHYMLTTMGFLVYVLRDDTDYQSIKKRYGI